MSLLAVAQDGWLLPVRSRQTLEGWRCSTFAT